MFALAITFSIFATVLCAPINVHEATPSLVNFEPVDAYHVIFGNVENIKEVPLKSVILCSAESSKVKSSKGSEGDNATTTDNGQFPDEISNYRLFLERAREATEAMMDKIDRLANLSDDDLSDMMEALLTGELNENYESITPVKVLREILCPKLLEDAQDHVRLMLEKLAQGLSTLFGEGITVEEVKNMIATVKFVERYHGLPNYHDFDSWPPSVEGEPNLFAFSDYNVPVKKAGGSVKKAWPTI